ncbi:transposase [Escherichia coli]|nr:transposase [Escherichia coli]NJV49739.1 transposase [Escherichia coli]
MSPAFAPSHLRTIGTSIDINGRFFMTEIRATQGFSLFFAQPKSTYINLWARRPSGTIHHSDKGSQYVSLAYTERLKEAGLLASTGSTGDSYDNAMAESINGLYKAEVIHRKSWKNRAEVELATLTWVDWYNNRRLLGRLGHTPPAEAEKAYYASIGNDDLAA